MGSVASSVMIVMRSSGRKRRQVWMALCAPGRSSGSFDFNGETVWHGGGHGTVKTRNLPHNPARGKETRSVLHPRALLRRRGNQVAPPARAR